MSVCRLFIAAMEIKSWFNELLKKSEETKNLHEDNRHFNPLNLNCCYTCNYKSYKASLIGQ